MHVVYIKYHYNPKIKNPEEYFHFNKEKTEFYTTIKQSGVNKISIIQRAPFSTKKILSGITWYFINDEFDPVLRWCDKPVKINTTAAAIEADIIHIYGLDLPIHFRWLRKTTGEKTVLLGQHTGEKKWLQRILWLQQFGLRVADGFIFKNKKEAKSWLKAAVILPKQAAYTIADIDQYKKRAADRLVKIYNGLTK
jgi:hypothetical protein